MDTLVVVVVLLAKYPDRKPFWRRAYRKAVQFISQQTGRNKSDVEQLLENFQRSLTEATSTWKYLYMLAVRGDFKGRRTPKYVPSNDKEEAGEAVTRY
jgi:hypothetical protein